MTFDGAILMLLGMEKRDIGQRAQEEVCRQAVEPLKAGHTRMEVAAQLDVSRSMSESGGRYEEGGWSALKRRKRGVAEGAFA